jgi:uncharacterized membrane protein YphA (DoxX/SURF4 family)
MRRLLESINRYSEKWLFESFTVSPESLGLYRIAFAAYPLLFGVPSFVWISTNPQVFWAPAPSLARFFSGFPDYLVLQLLSSLVCLLFIMLLFGYKTRLVSITLTTTLIVANSFRYSFGKIDHDIMVVITPLVMSFSAWGARFSLDSRQRKNGGYDSAVDRSWPIALMALFVAFGFFSAGLPKALKWIDFDLSTSGVRSWVQASVFWGRESLLVPFFANITNTLFWEALDILAVAFEIGFLFALVWPKVFRLYVGLAVLFHFNNHLMLNIAFEEYMIVYLLFLNWQPVVSYLEKKGLLDKLQEIIRLEYMIAFAVLYLPFYYLAQGVVTGTSALTSSPLQYFVRSGFGLEYYDLRGAVVVSAAAAIVLWIALPKMARLLLPFGRSAEPRY